MASKNKVYIVTMYRWGERDNHSYVLGVYNKKHKAIEEGNKHELERGNKYHPEVIETEMNTLCVSEINCTKTIVEIEGDR